MQFAGIFECHRHDWLSERSSPIARKSYPQIGLDEIGASKISTRWEIRVDRRECFVVLAVPEACLSLLCLIAVLLPPHIRRFMCLQLHASQKSFFSFSKPGDA